MTTERKLEIHYAEDRIRAEVAEEIAQHLNRLSRATTSGLAREAWRSAAAVAREHARSSAESVAAGSAVPAEGSGHPPAVGRLPWPHGADPVTDAWLRSQGLNPEEVAAQVREHIDTLIRRTGGDDRG
jgi:hypothetical protein